jgi:galactosamine-6-phosphate isomerase
MSRRAAGLVEEELHKMPDLLLCAATGNSPAGLYREMSARASQKPELFDRMRILKLDEWGGIPENHPASCEYFLRKKLLEPLSIPDKRYLSFFSDAEDPDTQCVAMRNRLAKEGPVHICILGLGQNGHLGLNEPGETLEPFFHRTELSDSSLEHEMIASMENKPTYGISLGMQEILSSKKIILLVTGEGKKEVYTRLMEGKISTKLPASFLWTHPDVICLLDRTYLD